MKLFFVLLPLLAFLFGVLSAEEMGRAVTAAAAPATGKQAVLGASSLRTLAEGETVQESGEPVLYVEERILFLRDGIWTQSTYADEETIGLVTLSEAYFELLDLFPSITPYLSIGDRVILKVGEVWLQFGETGL